jgi:hypothetical protein
MQLRYFVVDADGQFCRTPAELVEAFWRGDCPADRLDVPPEGPLQLVTALIDDDLNPVVVYFIRLELEDGAICETSRKTAFDAVTARHGRRFDSDAAKQQFIGWPADWQTQLAVALDVPAASLTKLGLGGPLLLADLWGIPMNKVLGYFEEAAGE